MRVIFLIRFALFFIIILLLFASCRTHKKSTQRVSGKASIEHSVESSTTFNGLTGFVLMDQASSEILYEKNADTYFTPASNTKILTLYAAMKILGDKMPGLNYTKTKEGEIYIQGTGHPALLNPAFSTTENSVLGFLQKQTMPMVYCDCNFQDEKYGSGWSWDDFNYYFQTEKSPLPLYGNNVTFIKNSKTDNLFTIPPYFKKQTQIISDSSITKLKVFRNWDDNQFTAQLPINNTSTKKDHPFRADRETIIQLLSDTLHQKIKYCNNTCTKKEFIEIKSNIPSQEMYKQLMQPSDNFVAEQLLLLCANQLFDTLDVMRTIRWAQDSLFQFLPNQAKWVDGSGLSRYNMITPRSMAMVLNQLYQDYPEEQLFDLFPTGGESGTIKDWYGGLEKPYVFAKTGTLRHIHCLSGYLITKRGQRLVFSFMHNNYIGSMRDLKREMEKILQQVYVEF